MPFNKTKLWMDMGAGKLVIPLNREAANFRSIIGMIDGRTELKPLPASTDSYDDEHQLLHWSGISSNKAMEECIIDVESGEWYNIAKVPLIKEQYCMVEVTVMAAKLAYENEAYIKNVVNNIWKVQLTTATRIRMKWLKLIPRTHLTRVAKSYNLNDRRLSLHGRINH
jgi:hypothetical protein